MIESRLGRRSLFFILWYAFYISYKYCLIQFLYSLKSILLLFYAKLGLGREWSKVLLSSLKQLFWIVLKLVRLIKLQKILDYSLFRYFNLIIIFYKFLYHLQNIFWEFPHSQLLRAISFDSLHYFQSGF
jgi:hypothetical protein